MTMSVIRDRRTPNTLVFEGIVRRNGKELQSVLLRGYR
jgi:hypothetical protein